VAMALLAAAAASASGQTSLEWKLKEGDKFYVETKSNATVQMEIGGMKLPNQTTERTEISSFKVLRNDKNGLVLEQKFESVKHQQAPKNNPEPAIREKLVGQSLTFAVNAKGEVTKLDGYDALVQKLAGGDAAKLAIIKGLVGADNLKRDVESTFGYAPGKPVKPGDTWTRKMPVSLAEFGIFNFDYLYTYEGPGKEGERIIMKPSVAYQPAATGAGLPFQITDGKFVAETATGNVVFDPKLGRPTHGDMQLKLKGTLDVIARGNKTQMLLDMDMVSRARVLTEMPK
jgi:hypothetical protein